MFQMESIERKPLPYKSKETEALRVLFELSRIRARFPFLATMFTFIVPKCPILKVT